MLVLSRNIGEEIVIGREVVVGVVKVTRNRVYLAIEAPANIHVDRKEIWLSKKQKGESSHVELFIAEARARDGTTAGIHRA
jgi:carbon storage regulator CsrA